MSFRRKLFTPTFLVGLVFLVAGSLLLFNGFQQFVVYHGLHHGVEVDAELISVMKKPGRSNTEWTDVRYRYEYDGGVYVGDRIDISFWPEGGRRYSELQDALTSGKRIPCYVDTDHPQESTLDRSFSYVAAIGLCIFAAIFPLVGFFLMRLAVKYE